MLTAALAGAGVANGAASRIATRLLHTCAVTTAGGVKCWGDNRYGQLGDGTTTNRPTAEDVDGLTSGVVAVAAGDSHTCALTTTGGLKCWGRDLRGELGDGTTTQRLTAVDVAGLSSPIAAIATGAAHTCAVTTEGGAKCWGDNAVGQLGDGTKIQRQTAVDVSGLTSGVVAVAAGSLHTCALTADGGVKCWGDNQEGKVGDGTTTRRLTAVDVSGLTNGVAAIAGTCALTRAGGVKCWGPGVLGNGATWLTPLDIAGLTSGVAAIAEGGGHKCALTVGGGVKCWGLNTSGQVGDGTTTLRPTAVSVSGLTSGVVAVAAGSGHTCALTADGGVKCWGAYDDGRLGDGTTLELARRAGAPDPKNRLTPVSVIGFPSGVAGSPANGVP